MLEATKERFEAEFGVATTSSANFVSWEHDGTTVLAISRKDIAGPISVWLSWAELKAPNGIDCEIVDPDSIDPADPASTLAGNTRNRLLQIRVNDLNTVHDTITFIKHAGRNSKPARLTTIFRRTFAPFFIVASMLFGRYFNLFGYDAMWPIISSTLIAICCASMLLSGDRKGLAASIYGVIATSSLLLYGYSLNGSLELVKIFIPLVMPITWLLSCAWLIWHWLALHDVNERIFSNRFRYVLTLVGSLIATSILFDIFSKLTIHRTLLRSAIDVYEHFWGELPSSVISYIDMITDAKLFLLGITLLCSMLIAIVAAPHPNAPGGRRRGIVDSLFSTKIGNSRIAIDSNSSPAARIIEVASIVESAIRKFPGVVIKIILEAIDTTTTNFLAAWYLLGRAINGLLIIAALSGSSTVLIQSLLSTIHGDVPALSWSGTTIMTCLVSSLVYMSIIVEYRRLPLVLALSKDAQLFVRSREARSFPLRALIISLLIMPCCIVSVTIVSHVLDIFHVHSRTESATIWSSPLPSASMFFVVIMSISIISYFLGRLANTKTLSTRMRAILLHSYSDLSRIVRLIRKLINNILSYSRATSRTFDSVRRDPASQSDDPDSHNPVVMPNTIRPSSHRSKSNVDSKTMSRNSKNQSD
ncbi:MAG: hypothetical protein H6814_09010 [Phycisphaeraceae bacterium]|nr:hypothetical protein [Phycisphaeraceae bacterium]